MRIDKIGSEVEKAVKDVLRQYADIVFREALTGIPTSIASSFSIAVYDDGLHVSIYSNNELAAYYEFGTGQFAREYLSGKPKEMVDDAWKFKKATDGHSEEHPYLYPTFYKYKDEIIIEIDKRIQRIFDSVKL